MQNILKTKQSINYSGMREEGLATSNNVNITVKINVARKKELAVIQCQPESESNFGVGAFFKCTRNKIPLNSN